MSLYTRDDERAIRVRRLVDDWVTSGLLQAEQRDQVLPSLHVDLRRTNTFLRITLFLFAFLIVNAVIGLVAVNATALAIMFDNRQASDILRWLSGGASVTLLWLAQFVVKRFRVYHFGVEEAIAVASVIYMALALAQLPETFSTLLGFAGATIGAIVIFLRFNYTYAAVAAIVLAPLVVFDYEQSDTFRRLVAFILLFSVFFVARERREDHEPDHPADVFGLVQAVAWAGMYFISNLKISALLSVPDGYEAIYWTTYGVIWIMPVAGLAMAIRDRHRVLLNVSIVLAIVTMLSNKPYLGAEPKPWDPILFGLLLVAIAVGVKRWLASGPGGSRAGYVAERILASERDRLSLAGNATVLAPGAPPASPHDSPTFGGGESGGGGASARF